MSHAPYPHPPLRMSPDVPKICCNRCSHSDMTPTQTQFLERMGTRLYLCHITTLGSDFDGPFLRNTLNRMRIRMLLNLCRTSSSYLSMKCNSTRITPLSERQPAISICSYLFLLLIDR